MPPSTNASSPTDESRPGRPRPDERPSRIRPPGGSDPADRTGQPSADPLRLQEPPSDRPTPVEVMKEQIDHLLKCMDLPNVSIRVAAFASGLHYGTMSGPFVLMRFPSHGEGRTGEPPTVYVDSFTGALYLDKANEIERYDMAFTSIWASALDEASSRSFLKQVRRELGQ
ncbi:MAG: DUF5753 domain-containing protein [Streptosporangiaceae bacterium]